MLKQCMTALLTWNGIPPQVVGSLTAEQRRRVVSYAHTDMRKACVDEDGHPTQPFAQTAASIANSFTAWGARITDVYGVTIASKFLKAGDINVNRDKNLHSDLRNAGEQLRKNGNLVLRLLCVSTTGPDFINLTDRTDMNDVLDRHRINNGRVYEPTLLTLAQKEDRVIRLRPWQIIAFDANAPHLARGVTKAKRRTIQNAWIEIELPHNWQKRIKNGDAPTLHL